MQAQSNDVMPRIITGPDLKNERARAAANGTKLEPSRFSQKMQQQ
jgi:hypothetical protein